MRNTRSKNYLFPIVSALLLGLASSVAASPKGDMVACDAPLGAAVNVQELLENFDGVRLEGGGSVVIIQLVSNRNGKDREQNFRVMDNGQGASLVEFLDPRQRGTHILSVDNKMWFYASRTRRAIQVPSIQRVFGEASYGDLTQLMLSTEYLMREAACTASLDGTEVIKVPLSANADDETYSNLALFVDSQTHLPIGIDYFVASGKHIKSARFPDVEMKDGLVILNDWKLFAPDRPDRVTWIKTLSYETADWPAQMFTKRHLESRR